MPDGELGQTDAADELDLRALLGQPSDEGQSAMEEPIPQGAAAASADDNRPVEGRAQILSAFKRGAPQPEPQPRQPPPPPRPAEKPWFAGEREQPQPQHELSEAAVDEFVDEFVQGWRCGNIDWPRKLLGDPPGHPDCRLSAADLGRNRP